MDFTKEIADYIAQEQNLDAEKINQLMNLLPNAYEKEATVAV